MSLLMLGVDGQPKGRTYRDVMGLFATRAFLNGDGGARIELIPELEHGGYYHAGFVRTPAGWRVSRLSGGIVWWSGSVPDHLPWWGVDGDRFNQ